MGVTGVSPEMGGSQGTEIPRVSPELVGGTRSTVVRGVSQGLGMTPGVGGLRAWGNRGVTGTGGL